MAPLLSASHRFHQVSAELMGSNQHLLLRSAEQQGEQLINYQILVAALARQYRMAPIPNKHKNNVEILHWEISKPNTPLPQLRDIGLDVFIVDGSLKLESEILEKHVDSLMRHTGTRERGLLFVTTLGNAFWNVIICWHSDKAGESTGDEELDHQLRSLRAMDVRAGAIQCMWFNTDEGCLYPECEFLHDVSLATERRQLVLAERTENLFQPTQAQYQKLQKSLYAKSKELGPMAAMESLNQVSTVTLICANGKCGKAWPLDGGSPFQQCSRCKYTRYCLVVCQQLDWPRHRKEPCRPYVDVVEDDNEWTPYQLRKAMMKDPNWLSMAKIMNAKGVGPRGFREP